MKNEREKVISGRMPTDVREQIANLPDPVMQEKMCEELFNKVRGILDYHGVVYDEKKSTYRVKTRERIEEKIVERGTEAPVRDILGVEFVVQDADRYRVNDIIRDAFPLTPEFFEDGRPSIRDYSDPKVRDYIRENFNRNISSRFSALHINIVMPRAGSEIFDIAEVRIMTEEEQKIYDETREGYVNGRKNGETKP